VVWLRRRLLVAGAPSPIARGVCPGGRAPRTPTTALRTRGPSPRTSTTAVRTLSWDRFAELWFGVASRLPDGL